jgi:hypothetical protein
LPNYQTIFDNPAVFLCFGSKTSLNPVAGGIENKTGQAWQNYLIHDNAKPSARMGQKA